MSEIKELEARFEAAVAHLASAIEAKNGGDAAGSRADASLEAARARLTELEEENAQMAEDLTALKKQREQDLAELDQLIEQLKPLIEEVA